MFVMTKKQFKELYPKDTSGLCYDECNQSKKDMVVYMGENTRYFYDLKGDSATVCLCKDCLLIAVNLLVRKEK